MLTSEKLKRDLLIYGLDEPFQITDFISSFEDYYNYDNESEKNIKILDIIRYFLESNIFEIGEDYDFEKWDLSLEDTLLKIKLILNSDESLLFKAFFNLTNKGRKEALIYVDKENVIQENILLACCDDIVNIEKIMELIKEVFATYDPEEIEYEFLYCISSLADRHFIEVITFTADQFQTLKYSIYPVPFENKIQEQLEYNKTHQIKDSIFLKITPKGKLLIEEWKKLGGRISDHFDKVLKTSD
jgi:hypothetical protein